MDSVPLKQLMKYFVNHLYPQNTSHDIPRRVLPRLVSANSSRRVDSAESVDYFRLLFAYTDTHVPRTRKRKARRGSVQGLPREYSGARGEHAGAADRGKVSAVP